MTAEKNNDLLDASCRVALSALLHDLGKFAERADITVSKEQLDAHKTIYCPWNVFESSQQGYHSHVHAAYTALAFDILEDHVPDLIEADVYPFASRAELQGAEPAVDIDSLINVAAMHHRPQTMMQWIVATADRVASGFERETYEEYNRAKEEHTDTRTGRNHYQARMLSLFEEASLFSAQKRKPRAELHYRYPLKPFSPTNIYPQKRQACEPDNNALAKEQYARLWEQFLQGIEKIPYSHRHSWALWLDHFDTAWMTYTQSIPSATAFGTRPDVSLYDHSKTTAALAVALWRWHLETARMTPTDQEMLRTRKDWDEDKILLIQGDFFGIQDFVFADGSQTRKNAVSLLRGRSFQVSLFTELAALRILEELQLPSTSQITNAAGKFLIVAPNTESARAKLRDLRKEFDQWFLEQSFGLAGLGIASRAASCNDFLETKPENRFSQLLKALFEDLELVKLRRFNLLTDAPTTFAADYPDGVCRYNNKLANDGQEGPGFCSAALSRDQIKIGQGLRGKERLLVVRDSKELQDRGLIRLEIPIFGYQVAFADSAEASGKFGNLIREQALVRCWDFSLPKDLQEVPWHGYARRYVNGYVPRFDELDLKFQYKYLGEEIEELGDARILHKSKTFSHLACEDRRLTTPMEEQASDWIGQVALLTAKGDVDDLGLLFQRGLQAPTFTKMAALSRMVNAFFAVYLPALCAEKFPNTYTVFAGGDDFFVLGPWLSTQRLLTHLRQDFSRFVAENPDISFSVGAIMTKPNVPIDLLTLQAEQALDVAKGAGFENTNSEQPRKNALVIYGERISWQQWPLLMGMEQELEQLVHDYELSSSYVYSLLSLTDQASNESSAQPENYLWRSRFSYRTYRALAERISGKEAQEKIQRAQSELATKIAFNGIEQWRSRYKIPLFNYFYQRRA